MVAGPRNHWRDEGLAVDAASPFCLVLERSRLHDLRHTYASLLIARTHSRLLKLSGSIIPPSGGEAGVGLSTLRSTLMFRASTPNHVDSLSPWAGVRRASRSFSALQHREEVAGRLRDFEQEDGETGRDDDG